ncbi:hypothetical protein GCM10023114_47290 [Mycolicibacterium sediminis]|uniref:Uncharacterized protein n=1 Tax=Mycolicibacterium sediminis TaxID=1286180 RepID=A0A7I7QMA9_9MYCO|nr:hypothetical protein MSEDJ_16140 [Mycolicibacterium sediminis]
MEVDTGVGSAALVDCVGVAPPDPHAMVIAEAATTAQRARDAVLVGARDGTMVTEANGSPC